MLLINDISFQYDDGDGFAIENLNLSVQSGEFITILGPNGSGKSTLLGLILGNLNPRTGEIVFQDKPYSQYSKRGLAQKISFVPQRYYSVFPFSVFEIVMMGRTPYLNSLGFEKQTDIQTVNDALKEVGIYHLRNKSINSISGGEAQRAFIARALVQEPELILLDEPNAHLDLEHQISIFELLKKLNIENRVTIIVVSHDLNLAGYYGSRTILMQNGEIFLDDHKSLVLTEANIASVFNVNAKIIKNNDHINIAVYP